MTSNDLDRACAQVGLFMYHFANLENQIDAAVAKLFELKNNTAQMINGSVDFFKRYNFVRTAVRYQVDKNEYKRLEKILKKVTDHNNARQVVAHSRFEPAGDGVSAPQCSKAAGADGSRPARANALNDDVVNDRADARCEFRSQSGCFLLLDRVDKSPQIDGAVLNRDGEHSRAQPFCVQSRQYLFTQLGVIGGRKGGEFFSRAR
jgi:hypothetical protein